MPPRKRNVSNRTIAKHMKALGFDVSAGGNIGDVLKAFTGGGTGTGDTYRETEKDRYDRIRNELEMAEERVTLEAESTIYYVSVRGKGFTDKICKQCDEPFTTTYRAVNYCSELCRYKSLAEIGIAWNVNGKTDLERWGGRIPKVLGPQAFKAALEAVERQIAQEEAEDAAAPSVDPMIDQDDEDLDLRVQEILGEVEIEQEGEM
jgi:hypothetical protein